MRKLGKRIAAVTGTAAAVAGFTLALSAPAQATAADCQSYLQSMGYVVGDVAINSCAQGADGQQWAHSRCRAGLINIGVAEAHNIEACNRAAW